MAEAEGEGGGSPPESSNRNARLVHAVLDANPRAAEPLRQEYCTVCKVMAEEGATSASRMLTCNQWRCGLRDPERLRAEQEWAAVMLHLLSDPARTNPIDLANFNRHIAQAGCAVLGLTTGAHGVPTLGVIASTLRGQLHAALIGGFAVQAGDVQRNIAGMTITDAKGVINAQRDTCLEWMKKRAAALRAEGVSDKKIAQQLGHDPKTIRNWLGPREQG